MTTVLCTNAYKAAYTANKGRARVSSLPVASTLLIRTHDGHLLITPFRFDKLAEYTEAVPARIEIGEEIATCVPAKPFVDWLRVTQTKPTSRDYKELTQRAKDDQIELTLDSKCQNLYIKAGNTRAMFKCIDAQEFPALH